jgi:uncharacterized protein with HEPN domain
MRRAATLRKLEVIGQNGENLSERAKSHGRILRGNRSHWHAQQVIHDYFGVNLEIVWQRFRRSYRRSASQQLPS